MQFCESEKDSDEDDLFDQYIEIDCDASGSDGEKENRKRVKMSKPIAKKVQFKKLDSFMKEHNKSQMNTDEFNELWNNLVIELNSEGPPTFTGQEWKVKWSQHKYNRKRKRSTIPGPSCDVPVAGKIAQETDHCDIFDKLDVIIKKEDAILDKLDTNNRLLQEIAQNLRKT